MDALNTTVVAATAASVALTTASGPADGATTALSSVITRASDVVVAHGSSSWIGLIARLILWILQLLSTIIYYALKLTTISIPTLLFSLFSASLTVTMNATTLYVLTVPMSVSTIPVLTVCQHAHRGNGLLCHYVGGTVPVPQHVLEAAARATEERARC